MTTKKQIILTIIAVIFVVLLLNTVTSFIALPDKEWGISMSIEDVGKTGGKVRIEKKDAETNSQMLTGAAYWIEKRTFFSWKALEYETGSAFFTSVAYLLDNSNSYETDVNWEHMYGKLPMGIYRIGKNVSKDYAYNLDADEQEGMHRNYYAPFIVVSWWEILIIVSLALVIGISIWMIRRLRLQYLFINLKKKFQTLEIRKCSVGVGVIIGSVLLCSVLFQELQAPVSNLWHHISVSIDGSDRNSVNGILTYSGVKDDEVRMREDYYIEKRTALGWKKLRGFHVGSDDIATKWYTNGFEEGEQEFRFGWEYYFDREDQLTNGRYRLRFGLDKMQRNERGKPERVGAGNFYITFRVADAPSASFFESIWWEIILILLIVVAIGTAIFGIIFLRRRWNVYGLYLERIKERFVTTGKAMNRKTILILSASIVVLLVVGWFTYQALESTLSNMRYRVRVEVEESTPYGIKGEIVHGKMGMVEIPVAPFGYRIEKRTFWGWKQVGSAPGDDAFSNRAARGSIGYGTFDFNLDWSEDCNELTDGTYRVKFPLFRNREDAKAIGAIYIPFTIKNAKEYKVYKFYDEFEYEEPEVLEYNISEGLDMTKLDMNEYFRTAYGWKSLESHTVRWSEAENQLSLQFVFVPEAPLWQVQSSREYGLNTFVHKQMLNQVSQTYQMWAREQDIQHVYVETFVQRDLLTQDYYYVEKEFYVEKEVHYENEEVLVNGQNYRPEDEDKLKGKLNQYLPAKSRIHFQTDVKEADIIVKIESGRQVNPDHINRIKKELQNLCKDADDVILKLYDNEENLYYQTEVTD